MNELPHKTTEVRKCVAYVSFFCKELSMLNEQELLSPFTNQKNPETFHAG